MAKTKLKQVSRFIPNPGSLLVRVKDSPKYTESGLFIPDSAQVPQTEATVVAVNDTTGNLYPVGTRIVLTNKFAGTQIKIDGEDLLVVRCDYENSEVLGVMA